MSVLHITPVTSEKAYATSLANVYSFKVPLTANKQQIASAVEAQYGVSVVAVKSLIQKGKAIAFSRGKRGRPGTTQRKDVKKAYVTLKEGDSIKIFDEPETDKKQAAPTQAKQDTATTAVKSPSRLKTALRRGSGRGGDR